jgi:hypothetical protein
MPTVPFSSVPRVSPQPLQPPRLNPTAPIEAFGGGIAAEKGGLGDLSGAQQGVQRIADETQRMRLQEKARADQIAITDVGGQLAFYRNHSMHDPDTGWMNQFGKNAFEVPEKARDEFWNVAKVMRASLASDDQRAVFDKIATSEWDQMDGQIQQHVAKQKIVYDNDSTQAALDAQHDKAVKGYDDPGVVEPAIVARQAVIEAHGQRNGLPDEFIAQQVKEATSQTRFDVLQQFVDNHQDLAASSYLNRYRDQLVGKNLTQAEVLVNHSSVEGEAQRQTDGITKTATGLTDALGQAATIQEPEVRKSAEQRIRQHYADVASDEREKRTAARQNLGTMLEQTHGDLTAINRSKAWTLDLNDTDRTALEHRADQIRNPVARSNQAIATHWRQMSALNPSTQAAFLAEDFSRGKYQSELSEADRNWLISRQITLRRQQGTPDAPRADRSVMRKEETAVLKSNRAAAQAQDRLQAMPPNQRKAIEQAQKFAPPTAPIVVPKWMLDSAAHDAEYRDYLKMNGVTVPDATSGPIGNTDLRNPPAPKVPGAPIVRPPAPQAPAAPQKKKGVNVIRDSNGRATSIVPQD